MLENEAEILMISRSLTPKHKADLLSWVNLAYTAEHSARKSMDFRFINDIKSPIKTQDFTCEN